LENKNLFILGRNDDVINIRGHRIGSGEIESIILKIDLIHEACAIDIPSDLEGNQLILILTAKKTKNLINKVNHQIVNFFGNYALPKKIYFVNNLPKTKSGKILRRVIRKILINNGKNIGDISTINDKQNLDKIKKLIIHDPIN
jgi:acetyl-CoA synthetase